MSFKAYVKVIWYLYCVFIRQDSQPRLSILLRVFITSSASLSGLNVSSRSETERRFPRRLISSQTHNCTCHCIVYTVCVCLFVKASMNNVHFNLKAFGVSEALMCVSFTSAANNHFIINESADYFQFNL